MSRRGHQRDHHLDGYATSLADHALGPQRAAPRGAVRSPGDEDISLALKASEGQDGDEASNIFVKLVKDMSVMQFDDRASFRVVARSVDGDGEEGDPK